MSWLVDTPLAGFPAELPAHLAAELAELLEDAERYAAAAQALNTTRAYASDWNQFQAWCEHYRLESLPASAAVIGLYVTSLAKRGLAVSTIRRRAAAIARAHRQAGHLPATSDPRVLTVLEGIARVHGSAPHKKTALLRDPLLEMIDRIDPPLIVYAEPPRPCPVRALRAWIDAAAIITGPVFRRVTRTGAVSSPLTARSVALIIKKRVRAAGLDPREFAGHSLRSGYATQAARDGHHPTQIAATTRHQDQRVLAGYIRAGRGKEDIAHVP